MRSSCNIETERHKRCMRLKSPYEVRNFAIGVYLEEWRIINFIHLFRDILSSCLRCTCFPVPHGKIVGKTNVKYEGLSLSVKGVDSVTTLIVISSLSIASRRSVAISRGIDTSLMSKIADVVMGRSPSCSRVSTSSLAKPDREISSSDASLIWPIDSRRLVAINTGGHLANSSWSMVTC